MNKVVDLSSESASLNAKETDNKELNSELIKRTDVRDTPFTVIEIDGKVFGAMGQHRITEIGDDKIKIIKELKKFSWNRVMQVMLLLSEQGLFDKDINNINNK